MVCTVSTELELLTENLAVLDHFVRSIWLNPPPQ